MISQTESMFQKLFKFLKKKINGIYEVDSTMMLHIYFYQHPFSSDGIKSITDKTDEILSENGFGFFNAWKGIDDNKSFEFYSNVETNNHILLIVNID